MNMRILLLLLAFLLALPSSAYDNLVTHPSLSRSAYDKSKLTTDPKLFKDLGLNSQLAPLPVELDGVLQRRVPREILSNGARLEDEPWYLIPVRNHFYDPVHDKSYCLGACEKSPDWALEDMGEFTSQPFSFRDARNSMYLALTAPGSQSVRDAHWGSVFLALGHVIHHIQDMAQPHHVRDDSHTTFPPYPPILPGSRYETYTEGTAGVVDGLASSAPPPVFPGAIDFKQPREFWFKAPADGDNGIAQFTNHHFLSPDTNFTGIGPNGYAISDADYPRPMNSGPPKDYTIEELYGAQNQPVPASIVFLCSNQGVPCSMSMYPTPGVSKASTLSIFDQDLSAKGLVVFYDEGGRELVPVNRLFALNRFNFDEAQKTLIPKAVSYSAGLLNYFFRGRLEVALPSLGAYAVADHSAGEGFDTIRAKIKNVTPSENLDGGQVVAVVRFRRNECYKPDLSGEFEASPSGQPIPPHCDTGKTYVTNEVFITKSQVQRLSLASDTERELTFHFPEPVPFDATDVYLQVVYSGKVGEEEESIAVGTADISEPSYTASFNATDLIVLADNFGRGTFYYWVYVSNNLAQPQFSVVDLDHDGHYLSPPDMNIEGGDLHVDASIVVGQDKTLIGHIPVLPEGRFGRIALLLGSSCKIEYYVTGNGFDYAYTDTMSAKIGRVDWDAGRYRMSLLWRDRNQKLQVHAAFHLHGLVPPLDPNMLYQMKSEATDATQPVKVTMALGFAEPVRSASGVGGTAALGAGLEGPEGTLGTLRFSGGGGGDAPSPASLPLREVWPSQPRQ